MAMRWLKRSAQCAAAAFALLACSAAASAQIPSPGYFFLEVNDEADNLVPGAATVVYDSAGKELESSVTDEYGHARLLQNREGTERFVFRVTKSGFVTYEGTFVTSGRYARKEIHIKLMRSLAPKPKAGDARRDAAKRTQARAGPSPTSVSGRARSWRRRGHAFAASRGHPT